ncbi:MAG: phosphoribosylaminoimidazolesuccinocarboxamide synthase [Gammaproteobacteria bacterium]|nr:phosphoribosylaminoimidazolesuccinocarboxamide synthase [Gammaproteobacteria bacterium]
MLLEPGLKSLKKVYQGKVRDIFEVDSAHWLIVTSDRISAFDVILPDLIPKKGIALNTVSNFWFDRFASQVDNHLSGISLEEVIQDDRELEILARRSIIVRRLKALPFEAIVRGYIIGSGWKEYQKTGRISGVPLPDNLVLAQKLEVPVFTPSTKAMVGEHDINISFDEVVNLVGRETAENVRDISLRMYGSAAEYALQRGIIIADTKFEFGLDEDENITLIDEALTSDSSRFWPKDSYVPGKNPKSFDKQYVRDYLETLDWNKQNPGPRLPREIIENTSKKYLKACEQLTGIRI